MIERTPGPDGIRSYRERRGWTHEQMADEVHAGPREVAAWEAGTIRVPREQSRLLRDLVTADHLAAEVIAAGLPPCPWADRNLPDLRVALASMPEPSLAEAEWAHVRDCPACRTLCMFRDELHVFPTDPGLGFDGPLFRLGRRLHAWPRVRGALGVLGMGGLVIAMCTVPSLLLRMLLEALPRPPQEMLIVGYGIATGCLVFTLLAKPVSALRRWPYAAGLLRALAAVFAGGVAAWTQDFEFELSDPQVLAAGAVIALVLGCAAGAYARWRDDGESPDEAAPAA